MGRGRGRRRGRGRGRGKEWKGERERGGEMVAEVEGEGRRVRKGRGEGRGEKGREREREREREGVPTLPKSRARPISERATMPCPFWGKTGVPSPENGTAPRQVLTHRVGYSGNHGSKICSSVSRLEH